MARHPWYICALCRDRITDIHGQLLEFANTSHTGGFAWRVVGGAEFRVAQGYLGLLDGRPVRVSPARFGGIVAEPVSVSAAELGPIDDAEDGGGQEGDRPEGRPPHS